MSTYYHVTPHSRTARIKREGLVAGKKPQWKNTFGGTLGSRKKIYLFSELDAAIQLAARLEYGIDKPVDILVIEIAATNLEPDPGIENHSGTWWMTDTTIPATAIKDVVPLTLQMKRDYVTRQNARFKKLA